MRRASLHVSVTMVSAGVRRVVVSVNATLSYHVSAYRWCIAPMTASPELGNDWAGTPCGIAILATAATIAAARGRPRRIDTGRVTKAPA